MTAEDLRPIVLLDDHGPALWQLREGAAALAIFSDTLAAQRYCDDGRSQLVPQSLTAPQFVTLLAECWKQGVKIAVLNPAGGRAPRAFDLQEILRTVREQMRQGIAPRFDFGKIPGTPEFGLE